MNLKISQIPSDRIVDKNANLLSKGVKEGLWVEDG